MEKQGKVEKQKMKRENRLLFGFLLGFGESKKGAESCEEEPLDRSVFENIVGESRDLEREEKDEHDAVGYGETTSGPTHAVATDEETPDEREIEGENSHSDHTSFDKEFDPVIVRIIGTMAGATETLGDSGEGVHA